MSEHKKISIILMHDDGSNRRYRISLKIYRCICTLMFLLPLAVALSAFVCVQLWQENRGLNATASRHEFAMREAQNVAEKLTNLRAILEQEDKAVTGPVLQNLARQSAKESIPSPPKSTEENDAAESGPGHADFPVVNTGLVSIENVTARLLRAGKMRINLDLRNPDSNKRNISGQVRGIFIANSGETFPLPLPADQADFKINRFKRSVFQPPVPPNISDTTNARIILEVYTDDNSLIYRNIYPLER